MKEQEKYANLKLEHDRLVKDVESETQRMNELENRYSKLGQDLQQSPVYICNETHISKKKHVDFSIGQWVALS